MKPSKNIVATIQVIPFNTNNDFSLSIIEKSIQYIKQRDNIEYRMGIMHTAIGGKYQDVMKLINDLQEEILLVNDDEYMINICIHASRNSDIDISDKLEQFVGI